MSTKGFMRHAPIVLAMHGAGATPLQIADALKARGLTGMRCDISSRVRHFLKAAERKRLVELVPMRTVDERIAASLERIAAVLEWQARPEWQRPLPRQVPR